MEAEGAGARGIEVAGVGPVSFGLLNQAVAWIVGVAVVTGRGRDPACRCTRTQSEEAVLRPVAVQVGRGGGARVSGVCDCVGPPARRGRVAGFRVSTARLDRG